uniref:Uncharacterized protein n=1 Tax=Anguilla anguilla TaxID=7936 RepID=A0A0E9T303_ANGAN
MVWFCWNQSEKIQDRRPPGTGLGTTDSEYSKFF